MLLDIQACFQIAHGTHQAREAILWQKIVSHDALLHLLANETPAEYEGPAGHMQKALEYRDDWQSRLLRTSSWSPPY
jgi:formate-dependent phosphoribosylglycinamide formyltransferase (GAR transformylase)